LENSLGAWWAARHPDSPLVREWDFLRFREDGSPAAGSFEGWPERAAEMTVMDPCCGSGHFLVEAFSMLWQMRAAEEGLSAVQAQDAVLRDNLFGLELDPRCVQIAMLAVALQAWKAGGGWRQLPVPNIACSGIPVRAPVQEWKALANGDQRLENALVRLHILFRDADTLGSMIDPKRATELTDASGLQASFDDVDWDDIAPLLQTAVQDEADDPATAVLGADAAGIARAADYLSRDYSLVCTNPPFLGRSDQVSTLQKFVASHFGLGQQDLATAFLLRGASLARGGSTSFVLPQNSLTLRSFAELRRQLLSDWSLLSVANLGAGAFETIPGEVVKPVLMIVQLRRNREQVSAVVDVSDARTATEKASRLGVAPLMGVPQVRQLSNPDSRILFEILDDFPSLGRFASSYTGLQTGEDTRYKRFFWEFGVIADGWERVQSSPSKSGPGAGREKVILWESGRGAMATSSASTIRGRAAWGREGLVVSKVGSLYWTDYAGGLFDDSAIVIIADSQDAIGAVSAYVRDERFRRDVRKIDQKAAVTPGTVVKVPFDVGYWRQVSLERSTGGISEAFSDDPTQWLFEGRPEGSKEPLQVAVARLVGYRWPEQPESDDLDAFVDADGIVCLPSVAGEAPGAHRMQELLAAANGDRWSPTMVAKLLAEAGSKKKNLADWLRDEFFKQHCAVFQNRPFVWHIWDGLPTGFSALVNYHRLDRQMLEKLTYTYLGTDWVERQRAEMRDEVAGAEARLAAALELKRKLELILEGESPYDIYVRWKSLAQQAVGWDPDPNDGVRLNIRPFVEAGVLRSPVKVDWRKDRGTNPDGGERHNDIHLTLADKTNARAGRTRT